MPAVVVSVGGAEGRTRNGTEYADRRGTAFKATLLRATTFEETVFEQHRSAGALKKTSFNCFFCTEIVVAVLLFNAVSASVRPIPLQSAFSS